jgi:phosphatidylserine decarboxylase
MIHKEGYKTIFYSLIVGIGLLLLFIGITPKILFVRVIIYSFFILYFFIILQFFRNPKRDIEINDENILSPADGKVVVIEDVIETEYLNTKCKQISVFMNIFNVHANWYPVNGVVKYYKYHPGLFLVAFNPKSSTDNERTTIVVETNTKKENILFRQIAGLIARRIVCYAKVGEQVTQNQQCGFIKFGSRLDIFIPLHYKINVKLGQKVKAGQTILAYSENPEAK